MGNGVWAMKCHVTHMCCEVVRSRSCYSVASVVCTEGIVAEWCVLEQKLLLIAYRKSYTRN